MSFFHSQKFDIIQGDTQWMIFKCPVIVTLLILELKSMPS